jgi:recombination endonuclease VII
MKTCSKCRHEKPMSEFSEDRRRKDGKQRICRQCGRDWYHEKSPEWKKSHARAAVCRRHGITVSQFVRMVVEQGGVCALCQVAPPTHIDHSHETGKIRGVLCHPCNAALGLFRESEETLVNALRYLDENR